MVLSNFNTTHLAADLTVCDFAESFSVIASFFAFSPDRDSDARKKVRRFIHKKLFASSKVAFEILMEQTNHVASETYSVEGGEKSVPL